MKKAKAKANANIALVKYWGKKDENLIIPYNNSISLTLEKFYTITKVYESDKDQFVLNGIVESEFEKNKISKFIDLFRELSGNNMGVKVVSDNYFPTAAGLASSASAFAALSCSLNELFDTGLNKRQLSIMARKGSGSATRSIYGGFVEWHKGFDDQSSYAQQIDPGNWDIAMIAVIINKNKKKVSSRNGMANTVNTCQFYDAWVDSSQGDIIMMKEAIKYRDVDAIGQIAESSAMKMHATMMATRPPIIYFQDETIEIIHQVEELRADGIKAYYTMDAGPNVKIITTSEYRDAIMDKLAPMVGRENLVYSGVGKDVELLGWEADDDRGI